MLVDAENNGTDTRRKLSLQNQTMEAYDCRSKCYGKARQVEVAVVEGWRCKDSRAANFGTCIVKAGESEQAGFRVDPLLLARRASDTDLTSRIGPANEVGN